MKTTLVKSIVTFILLSASIWTVKGQNIYTFAGIGACNLGAGDGGPAISAEICAPWAIAVDALGNVYITDSGNNRVRKVNTSGVISNFAGTNSAGFSGDGGAATSAQLNSPRGIAIDASGNIYISDYGNNRIRKVNTSGIISTIVGTGIAGFSGDGSTAINAQINNPLGLAVDASGNLYISDYVNQRIRKVNTVGIISTFAGTGVSGFNGDGGVATATQLFGPCGVAVDVAGKVYIADYFNWRIRIVNLAGVISTFAGTGVGGFSGDGGLATNAQLAAPAGIAVDPSNNFYVADRNNNRIRKINPAGIISTIAGTGVAGFSGDGNTATSAKLNNPVAVNFDASGNVYFADIINNRIRELCVGACLAGINSLTKNNSNVFIFPNPNNGSFKIQIDNEVSNSKLILINSLGQKSCEQNIFQGTNIINADELSKGLYHYVVSSPKIRTVC